MASPTLLRLAILALLVLASLLALSLPAAAARAGAAFAPLDGSAGGHGRALRTWGYWYRPVYRPFYSPWVVERPRVYWWGR
jgi:hypothetical protein